MTSKLLYILMDWETFNKEQVSSVIRALQASMIVLLTKIVSNLNLKMLTFLAKILILHAWLVQWYASADWYITVLKIETEICIDVRQLKMESWQGHPLWFWVPIFYFICMPNRVCKLTCTPEKLFAKKEICPPLVTIGNILPNGLEKFVGLHVLILIHPT